MKFNLITALCSVFVSLAFAEVLVRLIRPLGAEQIPQFVADADTGFRRQPNQHGFVYQRFPGEFNVRFHTNRLGMRDREHHFEKGGKLRVLILGDSFTEGWGVEEYQAYPKVLEAEYLKAEVWNMGVAGYGTDQEFQLLKDFLPDARPDIVVVGFYENDLVDNTLNKVLWNPYYVKPRFQVQDGQLTLTNRAALLQQMREADRVASSFNRRLKNLLEESALIRLIRWQKWAFDARHQTRATQTNVSENFF